METTKYFALAKAEAISRVKECQGEGFPGQPEQGCVYGLIYEHFSIGCEKLQGLVNYLIKLNYSHQTDKQLQDIYKRDRGLYELRNALRGFSKIEIQVKVDKGKSKAKTITIDDPQLITGFLEYLQDLSPDNLPPKPKRGQPENTNKNNFLKFGLLLCFEFLKKHGTKNKDSETDRCYFAGLILSLTGAIETPSQTNEPPEVYRELISDKLKRYNTPDLPFGMNSATFNRLKAEII